MQDGDTLSAQVHGTQSYRVKLQALREYAQPVGRWEEWRSQALAFLREQIEAEKARPSRFGLYARAYNSELVRILLWEGRGEDAWREAQQGGCAESLWLELAGKREKEHPEDALEVYRSRIAPLLEATTNGGYAEPVRLLLRIQRLMTRLGRQDEFARDIEQLRVTDERKRSFLKLLDEKMPTLKRR